MGTLKTAVKSSFPRESSRPLDESNRDRSGALRPARRNRRIREVGPTWSPTKRSQRDASQRPSRDGPRRPLRVNLRAGRLAQFPSRPRRPPPRFAEPRSDVQVARGPPLMRFSHSAEGPVMRRCASQARRRLAANASGDTPGPSCTRPRRGRLESFARIVSSPLTGAPTCTHSAFRAVTHLHGRSKASDLFRRDAPLQVHAAGAKSRHLKI